ncbi:LysM peptidoglycan-binding domain-containing protein [Phocicoccus pinnipedialis]|uniref:D-gamma-glutamyl-meso-diaminopimelic acid endopeptidase CwlS n=1 Tax=Phocicoccus pinnipedialis TaxID=110845 RepID=A0A6V7QZQ8_9BACL|nr:LysM peptidoglycan-binding domain-containing protein [Jeotgalicoccus pinnipedialis]MBP1938706.1 peptidoglycan endopeptidase LytE [Jeotgalicoccus pinnipedialis]CAD2070487.1 hypothetical protein JEOPIN946_00016 [Jeotgalicoccus pinnipedialis]
MKKSLVTLGSVAILSGAYATHTQAAEHTVQSGDTLWAIAAKANTTVDQLKHINNLNSDLIFPGDVIETEGEVKKAPTNKVSTGTYTVKSGDTLFNIGQKFNVSYKDIMVWNNLSTDLIFPGQKVKVEGTKVEAVTVQDNQASESTNKSNNVSYNTNNQSQSQNQTAQQSQSQQQVQQVQHTQSQPQQQVQTQNVSTQQKTQTPASTPASGNAYNVAVNLAAGKTYVYGANSTYAVDCSSFAQQFMRAYKGKNIARSTYGQASQGTPVSNPQPGDLVFFNNFSHVGVYVGNGMMVDALNPSEGVGLRAVSYVHGHVDGYYRY